MFVSALVLAQLQQHVVQVAVGIARQTADLQVRTLTITATAFVVHQVALLDLEVAGLHQLVPEWAVHRVAVVHEVAVIEDNIYASFALIKF